nr:hypothetical protein [Tanacetum cinerariifolium]
PIPDQAPAAHVGFAPQWIGGQIPNNNNGWLKEDPEDDEEDLEEDDEEDPEEEEDDEMNEDDDEEPEGCDGEFGHNFHVGESSSTRALLNGNSEVFASGPKCSDLMTIHRRTTKLERQMFKRYKTEIKIKKKFQEDDFRINRNEFKASGNYSKMTRLVEGLSKQVNELKFQCSRAKRLSQWEAWVRPCIPERDVAMATQEEDDDDDDDDDA